ncbi:MAG: bifunctional biotin--[acetyl-CoA-carboxylase] ligase/biotin operon repressor BirA [Immundisolibacter sp.]
MPPPSVTRLALLRALADGVWHRGSELAQRLGISRAAVSKQAQSLALWGAPVSTRRTHGYRLDGGLDLLHADRLKQLLHGVVPADGIELFDSIPSTNSHLMARIAAGDRPVVCLAEHQSAGRGRRGRHWHSPYGRNLYVSVAQRYEDGPAVLAGLSLAIGAALAQLLAGLGVAQLHLKWPNDILCASGKLGGILIELQGDTQGPCWAVAGLGLNVNMLTAEGGGIEQAWNSLARASGRTWDRTALAAQVVTTIYQVMRAFPTTGLEAWRATYARFDGLAGQVVQVDWAGERVDGVVCGIADNGALLLDCAGHRRQIWGGDVSVRVGLGSAV